MLEAANSTMALLPPEERPVWPGDESLRKIALAGKQWKRTVGRTLDMEGTVVYALDRGEGLTGHLQPMCTGCAWNGHDCGRTTASQ